MRLNPIVKWGLLYKICTKAVFEGGLVNSRSIVNLI